MVLDQLQALLSELYALDVSHDVRDFLVTDAGLARALDAAGRSSDEKLLIAEEDGEAAVALYLDAELVRRLGQNNPAAQLSLENLEDFWTALEGVSHFLYYVWNAALEKSVTLMEMELQAEVDKFVGTVLLLRRQGTRPPGNLHSCLFDLPRFDGRLGPEELDRYRSANRYAGRYCKKLAQGLSGAADPAALRRELRYFYRLPQPAKIEHIKAR
ncbi:MAG TPA: hypothetical protein VLD39_04810 [Gammaproteobacteria bacterium]|nr:hypothetical protein [Gammaproteobacteria bacterium]